MANYQVSRFFLITLFALPFLFGCQMRGRQRNVSRPESSKPVSMQEVRENPELQPQVEKPEFLEKESRKLGLILGPGGALTYAQIGFLQELESQKIPIHAIGGVEWGALIAGTYALEKKAHAIEWKLLKLPHKQFENKGFFSSGKSAVSVSKFGTFLSQVYGNKKFSDLEIPYACPMIIVPKEMRALRNRGTLKNAVRSCWPSAPHFEIETVGANTLGVAQLAKYLRKQGADLIVYVDVIGANKKIMGLDTKKKKPQSALSHIELGGISGLLTKPLIDEVIQIRVSGKYIDSYKDLRSIIRMGQVKSKASVKQMVKQYAY